MWGLFWLVATIWDTFGHAWSIPMASLMLGLHIDMSEYLHSAYLVFNHFFVPKSTVLGQADDNVTKGSEEYGQYSLYTQNSIEIRPESRMIGKWDNTPGYGVSTVCS